MISRNIKLSQKTTCITDSLRDSYHVPQDKFELIPNGVDTELFKTYPSQQLKQELGLNTNFVVGYVGVLREWVDFEPVFAAHNRRQLRLGFNLHHDSLLPVRLGRQRHQLLQQAVYVQRFALGGFGAGEIRQLIDDGRVETDVDAREAMYHEVVELSREDGAFLFLVNFENIYGLSERLDWKPRLDGRILITDMSLK